jgi:hypothetical protein
MKRASGHVVVCTGVLVWCSSVAFAQTEPPPDRKWEISVQAGGIFSSNPSRGTATPLPAGGTLPLATGGFAPRVSTWLMGDGARLLNDVNASTGVGLRVTPLDGLFASPLVENRRSGALGFRLARILTSRFSAELSIDYVPLGTRASSSGAGGLVATRTTFVNAMRGLVIDAQAFPQAQPPPTGSFGSGTGSELLTVGTVKVALTRSTRVKPFFTAGGGVESRFGDLPGGHVATTYGLSFGFPACVCLITERDEVRFRVTAPTREVVGVVGLGFDFQPRVTFWRGKAENQSRWGVRTEVRVYMGGRESATFVDTQPSSAKVVLDPEPPPDYPTSGVLVVGGSPALQFSNDPSVTGFESSLSGQALENVRVFEGRGARRRVALTTGVFLRF